MPDTMYAQRKPEGSRGSAPRSCLARGTILEHWPGEFHVSVTYLSSPKSICIPWRHAESVVCDASHGHAHGTTWRHDQYDDVNSPIARIGQ